MSYITRTGNLAEAPTLREGENGPYCYARVLVSDRIRQESGDYIDGPTVAYDVAVSGSQATNLVDTAPALRKHSRHVHRHLPRHRVQGRADHAPATRGASRRRSREPARPERHRRAPQGRRRELIQLPRCGASHRGRPAPLSVLIRTLRRFQ